MTSRRSTSRFAKELLVVVDRLAVGDDARGRLADAVGTAFREGDGDCVILFTEPVALAARRHAVDAAALHRALRVPERRHARARADAAALLVQQSARRVRAAATASARCSSTTSRSSFPTPSARCATARSIRGPSRATTTSAARSPSSRSARASRWTCRGSELPRAQREQLLHASDARLQGNLSLPRAISRRSATSSTSASFCGSIRPRRSVPTCHGTKLQAGGAATCASPAATSPRSASCRSIGCSRVARRRSQLDAVRAAGRRAHPQGGARPRAASSATSASTTSRCNRAHAHALRRRGAAHRARQLARLAARRHALRARRAVDRPASRATWTGCSRCCMRLRDGGNTRARRRARSRGDPRRRLHGGARARQRREGRPARVRRPDVARRARARSPAQYLTGEREIPRARRAPPRRSAVDHAHRRARAQPQGRRHPHSARRRHRRHRRLRIGQEHARARRAAIARSRRSSPASTRAKQHLGETRRRVRHAHRLRGARRRRAASIRARSANRRARIR